MTVIVSLPSRGRTPIAVDVGHEPSGLVLAVLVAAGARAEGRAAGDVRVVAGVPEGITRLPAGPPHLAVVDASPLGAGEAFARVQDGALGGAIELSEVGGCLVEALRLVSDGFFVLSPRVRALALQLRGVSARGLLILRLVRRGCTNEHIARRMGVSTSTVKREIAALFEHFDVQSRAALVARTGAVSAAAPRTEAPAVIRPARHMSR